MKALPILLLALIIVSGCKDDETEGQTQVCSCSLTTQTSTGFDSTFVYVGDTLSSIVGYNHTIEIGTSIKFGVPYVPHVIFSWTPDTWLSCSNCVSPVATPEADITYTLTATDTSGTIHVYESTIIVTSLNISSVVYMPNIFTPNGDGVNDIFNIYGWGIASGNMQIKDGNNIVFANQERNPQWDGTINGSRVTECSTFSYTIDLTLKDGTTQHIEGDLVLFNYDGTATPTCPDNFQDCRFGNQFDPTIGGGFNTSLNSGEICL